MAKNRTKYCGYRLAIILFTIFYTQSAMADFIGVYIGTGGWYHTSEGQINNNGTNADMQRDFGFDDEFAGFAYIAVEHPFPLIPNIRVSQYGIETTGAKTVTASSEFTFAGTAYTTGTAITTKLLWGEEDVLLYYEFLDNIVSFDLGLGLKQINGELSVTTGGVSNALKIEETLPITYVMFGAMIPGTGISFSIETTQTILGDSEITQTNTKVSYETSFMVGVEAGYRTSKMKLDKLNTISNGEIDFTGPFANLLVHF